jgi:hypothetical protein
LPAHTEQVALGAGREIGRQTADDRTGHLAPSAGLGDGCDRLLGVRDSALPGAPERHAHGLWASPSAQRSGAKTSSVNTDMLSHDDAARVVAQAAS